MHMNREEDVKLEDIPTHEVPSLTTVYQNTRMNHLWFLVKHKQEHLDIKILLQVSLLK